MRYPVGGSDRFRNPVSRHQPDWGIGLLRVEQCSHILAAVEDNVETVQRLLLRNTTHKVQNLQRRNTADFPHRRAQVSNYNASRPSLAST